MVGTCVVGLQWGDEAKGKIVDILTKEHNLVVRYNGGANAGHTVVRDGQTYKLSLLPSGILQPTIQSIIGNGVVVDPIRFIEEVETLQKQGVPVGTNLLVSTHAHIIFPYHVEEERLNESGPKEESLGTTGRGIGPCYQDKVGRHFSIRAGELVDHDHLLGRLGPIVERKNRILRALSPQARTFDATALARDYHALGQRMKPHLANTTVLLHRAVADGQRILFEAAQGSLLDVDHGTYPYVTSSNSSTAGVWSGSGVPARYLDRVVGILKSYTTRVGRGPFPTELDDGPQGIGERIRQAGKEFGTVTGRPRRCGWFDAVAARHSARLNGADELAVMLLDVLSGLEQLCVAVAYELDGERIDYFPADAHLLARCKPIYETLPGWKEDLTTARQLQDLPTAARRYVDRLAELFGLPVTYISVGPDRDQTIQVKR